MSAIGIIKTISCVIRWFNNTECKRAIVIDSLTYVDTIIYFVHNKPDDIRVRKGCLLIQDHRRRLLTIWTFLDSNNDVLSASNGIPYGRELIIKSIDDELKEALGDSKLLIIE